MITVLSSVTIFTFYSLLIFDWAQSVQIIEEMEKKKIANKLLGEFVTIKKVHAHFMMSMMLASLLICFVYLIVTLPILIAYSIWEFSCVKKNHKLIFENI